MDHQAPSYHPYHALRSILYIRNPSIRKRAPEISPKSSKTHLLSRKKSAQEKQRLAKHILHVRTDILCKRNRPIFSFHVSLNIVAPINFLTGPSAFELALGISSRFRCCLVYYTYYVSTAPLPPNFTIVTVYSNGIEKNCDGQFISLVARYVLK